MSVVEYFNNFSGLEMIFIIFCSFLLYLFISKILLKKSRKVRQFIDTNSYVV